MKTLLVALGFVAAVFGVTMLLGAKVRLAYDDPPIHSSSTPTITVTPLPGGAGTVSWMGGSSSTREGHEFELTVKNQTDQAERYQPVTEFYDYRGKLIRRHVIGPFEAPPHSMTYAVARLRVPPRELRYVHTSKHQMLDR